MNIAPNYISILFVATTLATIYFFYLASHKSKIGLFIIFGWLVLQSAIATVGFYLNTNTIPPRFLFLVLPPVLLIIILFNTKKGILFIDKLQLKYLYLLHVVRVPVEIVLYYLFIHKMVPQLMTFEGRNFDILSGLSALFIYYFGFYKNRLSNKILLTWNILCLLLLFNIVINAVLSAPFSFQQFAFDQPNIAVLYFPFNLLPAVVVPLVLFSHLVAIRQLLKVGSNRNMV